MPHSFELQRPTSESYAASMKRLEQCAFSRPESLQIIDMHQRLSLFLDGVSGAIRTVAFAQGSFRQNTDSTDTKSHFLDKDPLNMSVHTSFELDEDKMIRFGIGHEGLVADLVEVEPSIGHQPREFLAVHIPRGKLPTHVPSLERMSNGDPQAQAIIYANMGHHSIVDRVDAITDAYPYHPSFQEPEHLQAHAARVQYIAQVLLGYAAPTLHNR